ncbi:MAG: MotA/TolQ/ExbB proton channel family protein [Helicobacteraceae bacterium]|jgi:biopolymer transport protein ExbB|nr:MotA/TolQ/ExbB proton channel family protein [Helicobacteraceae bacterium]
MKKLIAVLFFCVSAAFGDNMDILLDRIKKGGEQERAAELTRLNRFLSERNSAAVLLKNTKAEYERLLAYGRELSSKADANERANAELNDDLRNRSGVLNELLGVFKQSAGEFKAETDASITSAQVPDRQGAITALADMREMPDADDLERFWALYLEEMILGGRIERFNANVVDQSGEKRERAIVRLGAFGAIGDGEYLVWKNGAITASTGQPSGGVQRQARAFEKATEARSVAIDPTRGSLLELFALRPGFWERMTQGGVIGYLILTLGVFGFCLGGLRIARLQAVDKAVKRQLADMKSPRSDNPLGRVMLDTRNAETTLDMELSDLEKGQGAIKLLAAAAPLLGLLGTVVGMIGAFQTITLFGAGDPKLMAGSISLALVTTMQGLIVAVPLLFIHGFLRYRSQTIGDRLEGALK